MKRKKVLAFLATMALTTGATATTFAANYSDVKTGTPVSTYVTDVTDKGIMEGETDTEFGVAEGTTRSDLVQALYKLNLNLPVTGSHEFTDIDGREDAAAIEWADDVGLFDNLKDDFFTDNKFEPDKDLTREEAAQILYSFAQKVDKTDVTKGVGKLEGYTDSNEATVSYTDAMKWAMGNKILTGDDLNTNETENAIRPTTVISKAETAQALSVYMTLRGNTQEEVNQIVNTVKPSTPVKTTPVSKPQTSTNQGQAVSTTAVQEEPEAPAEPEVTVPETPEVPDTPAPDNQETPTTPSEDEQQPTTPEQGAGDVTTPEQPETPEAPENPDQGGEVVDPGTGEGGETTEPEQPEQPENPDQGGDVEDPSVPTTPETPENPGQGGEVETPEEPEQHTHTWGSPVYVVDQEAVYGPSEWIIDKEAEYEQIKVVDKEAWTEEITAIHTVCYTCGLDFDAAGMSNQEVLDHQLNHMLNGESGQYGSKEVVVDTIYHPEEYHYENGALISPEEGHWTEAPLITPEQGHWEHTCEGCGTTENCSAPEA